MQQIILLLFLATNSLAITVNKCCQAGQKFDFKKKLCINSNQMDFIPPIFPIATRSNVPKHWIIDTKIPKCEEEHDLIQIIDTYFILINGSVYSGLFHNKIIQPENYCFDENGIFACISYFYSRRMMKCCGVEERFSLTMKTCVPSRWDIYKREGLNNYFMMGKGFPRCESEFVLMKSPLPNQFHIFMEESLEEILSSFCLEHVLEFPGK